MAYIRSFRIEGLAGREDVCSATLNEYVNVCFGFNGSGKTSLLRILHSALADSADLLTDVPFDTAEVVVYSYGRKQDIVYRLDKRPKEIPPTRAAVPADPSETQLMRPSLRRQRNKKLAWEKQPADVGRWSHKYLPIARLYASDEPEAQAAFYGEAISMSERALEAKFAENMRRAWRDYTADVARQINQAQESGLAHILESVISGIESSPEQGQTDPEEAYKAVSNFLVRRGMHQISQQEFLRRYERESQLRSVAKDIEAVERQIAQVNAPRENLKLLADRLFFGGKSLKLTDRELEVAVKDKPINLSGLSSGEKQLLRILVDTLSVGPSIILIDEPELSMHVDWQRQLIDAMRLLNPAAQKILATHSPEIMAKLPDNNIFKL